MRASKPQQSSTTPPTATARKLWEANSPRMLCAPHPIAPGHVPFVAGSGVLLHFNEISLRSTIQSPFFDHFDSCGESQADNESHHMMQALSFRCRPKLLRRLGFRPTSCLGKMASSGGQSRFVRNPPLCNHTGEPKRVGRRSTGPSVARKPPADPGLPGVVQGLSLLGGRIPSVEGRSQRLFSH